MAMTLGDTVRWSSQAGGQAKEKIGQVVAVIAPRTLPDRTVFASLYKGAGIGSQRDHESYVVRVDTGKLPGSSHKDYWPRVAGLRPVYIAKPLDLPPVSAKELIHLLNGFAETSGADKPVVVACHTGRTGIGATPRVAITGVHAGFDWNAGSLFLETSRPVGLAGPELEKLRVQSEDQAHKLYRIKRILANSVTPAADKLNQIGELLGVCMVKGVSTPAFLPFRSLSGDWYGIPAAQFQADTQRYNVATNNNDEAELLKFETGTTGWRAIESALDASLLTP